MESPESRPTPSQQPLAQGPPLSSLQPNSPTSQALEPPQGQQLQILVHFEKMLERFEKVFKGMQAKAPIECVGCVLLEGQAPSEILLDHQGQV